MNITPNTWRWAAMTGLWVLVAGLGFVVVVQAMLVSFAPFGHWQMPGIAKVEITNIERDDLGHITGRVLAQKDGRSQILVLAKEECLKLEAEEDVWVLENYFTGGARPNQFLLTPQRLLMEYPEPLILLVLLAIRRLRRAQLKAAKEIPDRPRTVWRDEFYTKAGRFSDIEETMETEEPGQGSQKTHNDSVL